MNELRVNPETGYLESANSTYAFNSKRKQEFLKLASDIVDTHKQWPDLGDLCRVVKINVRTFHEHINLDEKFASDWRELELKGEGTCLADMYAMRKKNPMYMFGWLRAKMPEKYDQTKRVILSTDNSLIKRLDSLAKQAIDAEIVPNPQITSTQTEVDK